MGRINDLPQHFIDEHHAWHHNGRRDFLSFHADFVRRVLDWYGTSRNDVWPWAEVPYRLRQDRYGWNTKNSGALTTPAEDALRLENQRPFEIPEPITAFRSTIPNETEFEILAHGQLHDLLHGGGAIEYGAPELANFHKAPYTTQFYNLHGMFEEWRQAYFRGGYRCNFPGNHAILVSIEENAIGPDAAEFVLQSAPWISWWKQLILRDGEGNSWTLETKNDMRDARNGLWAHQLHNGQNLDFWAGGFLGFGRHVATLSNLERLPPGSRITFRWVQDWDA